jgi:hypothetical protein
MGVRQRICRVEVVSRGRGQRSVVVQLAFDLGCTLGPPPGTGRGCICPSWLVAVQDFFWPFLALALVVDAVLMADATARQRAGDDGKNFPVQLLCLAPARDGAPSAAAALCHHTHTRA